LQACPRQPRFSKIRLSSSHRSGQFPISNGRRVHAGVQQPVEQPPLGTAAVETKAKLVRLHMLFPKPMVRPKDKRLRVLAESVGPRNGPFRHIALGEALHRFAAHVIKNLHTSRIWGIFLAESSGTAACTGVFSVPRPRFPPSFLPPMYASTVSTIQDSRYRPSRGGSCAALATSSGRRPPVSSAATLLLSRTARYIAQNHLHSRVWLPCMIVPVVSDTCLQHLHSQAFLALILQKFLTPHFVHVEPSDQRILDKRSRQASYIANRCWSSSMFMFSCWALHSPFFYRITPPYFLCVNLIGEFVNNIIPWVGIGADTTHPKKWLPRREADWGAITLGSKKVPVTPLHDGFKKWRLSASRPIIKFRADPS